MGAEPLRTSLGGYAWDETNLPYSPFSSIPLGGIALHRAPQANRRPASRLLHQTRLPYETRYLCLLRAPTEEGPGHPPATRRQKSLRDTILQS